MEEVFCAFFVSFRQGFVSEVSDFVEVGYFYEALWFPDNFDSVYAFFAVCFSQFFHCFVKDVSLANVYFFFRLHLEPVQKLRNYACSLCEVFFFAEVPRLEELYVYDVVAEFLCFVPVCAYNYAEEQVPAAGVINGNRQIVASFGIHGFGRYKNRPQLFGQG